MLFKHALCVLVSEKNSRQLCRYQKGVSACTPIVLLRLLMTLIALSKLLELLQGHTVLMTRTSIRAACAIQLG